MTRWAIGCMTGTSLDGLDVAIVEATGTALGLDARVAASTSVGLGAIADRLRTMTRGDAVTIEEVAACALAFGTLHAEAIGSFVEEAGITPSVCVVPGQTLFHAPPLSMQLLNPWPIARSLGCPVLHDLRSADIEAGGQGAPITPIADWVLFRSDTAARAIVNLGGFCNVTLLPADGSPEDVRGFDVCACNQLLDACAQRALGRRFDDDGNAAGRGTPDKDMVRALSTVLGSQSSAGRSLGTGDEAISLINAHAHLAPDDLLASACAGIGRCIGERVRDAGEIVLAGGGVHNATLVRSIADHAGSRCTNTSALGVGVQEREAACMAVLGLLSLDGVGITLAHVTGRAHALAHEGCWIGARP